MDSVLSLINWIEQYPVTGGVALTSVLTLISVVTKHLYSSASKSPYLSPTFFSCGKKYVVTAVQEYIPSEDVSGYKQIQHSLPEHWKKLIKIETSVFGLRHKVTPFDASASLAVVIRKTKHSREKLILFNR